jgi:hypothetical protein
MKNEPINPIVKRRRKVVVCFMVVKDYFGFKLSSR